MFLVRLLVSTSVASALTVAAAVPVAAQQLDAETSSVYTVKKGASSVGFTIYGSMIFKIKRDGKFKDFTGELAYDPANPGNTRVDLTVYTASVDMHNAENEQLMKSGQFFDVEHFPTMHFTNSQTDVRPDGTLAMTGDMTIRGVTKKMTIPVKVHSSVGTESVFEATFPIDRTEFGINGNPGYGGFSLKISKNVEIHLAIATAMQTR
jgi:polyisoprenoid-binding protein YceI